MQVTGEGKKKRPEGKKMGRRPCYWRRKKVRKKPRSNTAQSHNRNAIVCRRTGGEEVARLPKAKKQKQQKRGTGTIAGKKKSTEKR